MKRGPINVSVRSTKAAWWWCGAGCFFLVLLTLDWKLRRIQSRRGREDGTLRHEVKARSSRERARVVRRPTCTGLWIGYRPKADEAAGVPTLGAARCAESVIDYPALGASGVSSRCLPSPADGACCCRRRWDGRDAARMGCAADGSRAPSASSPNRGARGGLSGEPVMAEDRGGLRKAVHGMAGR